MARALDTIMLIELWCISLVVHYALYYSPLCLFSYFNLSHAQVRTWTTLERAKRGHMSGSEPSMPGLDPFHARRVRMVEVVLGEKVSPHATTR